MTPDEMANAIADLTEKVRVLTEELDLYRINGLADMFSGRGNQMFGGGAMRLDKNGMRILTKDNNTDRAIYFSSTLTAKPSTETVYSKIYGEHFDASTAGEFQGLTLKSYAKNSLAEIDVQAREQDIENTNDAIVTITAQGVADGTTLKIRAGMDDGAKPATIMLLNQVAMDADTVLKLGVYANDPAITAGSYTLLEDGMIWYNSTSDVFRIMRAGGINDLATTDNITSALTDYTQRGDGTLKTIASGVITITSAYHKVDTQSSASTDDLDTINGGLLGEILVLRANNSSRTVVVKNATGNIKLNSDFSLDNTFDSITLIYDGSNWIELARSDNGA